MLLAVSFLKIGFAQNTFPATGSAGIGTVLPNASAILEMQSTTQGLLTPRMTKNQRDAIASPANGLLIYQTNSSPGFYYYNGNTWKAIVPKTTNDWSENGNDIYNNNIGNVGIGTTTPLAPLHISNSSAGTMIRLQSPSPELSFYDAAGVYKGFVWYDGNNNMVLGTPCSNSTGSVKLRMACNDVMTVDPLGRLYLNGSSTEVGLYTNGTYSGGYFGSGADLYLNASRANIIQGTSTGNLILQTSTGVGQLSYAAGNVGIGTATPANKLTVQTADAKWGIIHSNGTVSVGTYVGSTGGWVATQSNSPLYFCTGLLNANGSAQMTLLLNGNVGIGTLSPGYKLSVNGTIQAKEVRVETGWSDFVFDKTYKLRSLNEVEKYIEQNKHLPEIPSAEEIQKNGLAMADVQTKMMQKIEELTLYIIKMQKEIDELKESKK